METYFSLFVASFLIYINTTLVYISVCKLNRKQNMASKDTVKLVREYLEKRHMTVPKCIALELLRNPETYASDIVKKANASDNMVPVAFFMTVYNRCFEILATVLGHEDMPNFDELLTAERELLLRRYIFLSDAPRGEKRFAAACAVAATMYEYVTNNEFGCRGHNFDYVLTKGHHDIFNPRNLLDYIREVDEKVAIECEGLKELSSASTPLAFKRYFFNSDDVGWARYEDLLEFEAQEKQLTDRAYSKNDRAGAYFYESSAASTTMILKEGKEDDCDEADDCDPDTELTYQSEDEDGFVVNGDDEKDDSDSETDYWSSSASDTDEEQNEDTKTDPVDNGEPAVANEDDAERSRYIVFVGDE